MTRLSRTIMRVLACVVLMVLLVGVPVIVVRLVGVPYASSAELRGAWQHRQIGADLVVRIGAAIFAVLWLWFAITAVFELWHIVAWRLGGPSVRLAPLPPGPTGAVRALVRFIVMSSVSATAAFGSVVPVATAAMAPAPAATAAAATSWATVSPNGSTVTLAKSTATHVAVGRETPFSLATMLGNANLRERIIELNVGRVGPDGMVWQGGVFPMGMEVALPQEQVVRTPLGAAHEVVGGDSYWAIADNHLTVQLARDATAQEVKEYTDSLISLNHPLLGHRDPALIVPGELVIFTSVASAPAVDERPVEDAHLDVPAVAEPVVVAPSHDVVSPDVSMHLPIIDLRGDPAVGVVPVRGADVDVVPEPSKPAAGRVASSGVASSGETSGHRTPYAAGLGAALMMSAGAVGLLGSRRRRQLRSAAVGTRLTPPTAAQARTEVLLRSLNAQERMARLDLALRSAAPALAAQSAGVQAAVMYDTGDVCLFVRGSATPALAEWKLDLHANTWRLSGETSLATLAGSARLCAQPCPAMVHVGGVAEGGELFVDLEAVGLLSVESPHSAAILRSVAASLAVSPFLEATRIFTVGLGDVALGSSGSESVDSLDAALDAATTSVGSTAQLAGAGSTFALRVAGAGGEAWEPAVVVALADEADVALTCAMLPGAVGGRGIGVVIGTDGPCTSSAASSWSLRFLNDQHTLEPLGVQVQPVGVSLDDIAALTSLLDDAHEVVVEATFAEATTFETIPVDVAPFVMPEWSLMVRVLGPVDVASSSGVPAACERSKAIELIVWLSQHRERPTRSAARTALWDLDVRDATFANVVSDARRAMARAVAPADGEEWITRTLTENLPLHEGVVSDAELLALRVQHARGLPSLDAIATLRPGVEMMTGLPFAGTSYLWTDAEGITSSLILLATGAAIELAHHYLLLGDVDGVFWATGQGLKVLSGQEELIALRMRAHARRGDLSGVRGEWESYERAIAADAWAAAEPAPKLVALRRELLTPNHSQQER